MSTEDNLLFLAYHLSKHDSEQLKFLCDVAQLVHSAGGQIDWDYIVRNARRWDIGPAAYYSLRRARDLLGAPVDSSALRQMRPGLIRRSLMDLLVDDDIFIAPPQSDAVRSETFALAHCLMMTRPSRMLAALSMHRGRTRRRSWPKTLLWIGVASCAALGRRLTKRRGLLHEAVSST